mmetsp:Transcript_23572/g.65588  ORF Transcript_23572/g.65588 Transcript_23572/m.65588 type:complete len:89 (-) Transcript_23572:14-280(-)
MFMTMMLFRPITLLTQVKQGKHQLMNQIRTQQQRTNFSKNNTNHWYLRMGEWRPPASCARATGLHNSTLPQSTEINALLGESYSGALG